jgi:ubiquinone/menaquinone biosynthesis C-methylase UbiE
MAHHKTEEAYDRVAKEYAVRHREVPARLAELGAHFLGYLAPGSRILDIGCGHGRDMAWMELQGFSATGIDISSGMLSQARQLVRGEVLHMDMCHLTFPERSFEGVWCCSSLLHVPQAQAQEALRHMRRVLVPGGMFFLSLLEGDGEAWEAEASEFADVQRLFVHYPLKAARASLSQAGFVSVEQYRDIAGKHTWLNFLARVVE